MEPLGRDAIKGLQAVRRLAEESTNELVERREQWLDADQHAVRASQYELAITYARAALLALHQAEIYVTAAERNDATILPLQPKGN